MKRLLRFFVHPFVLPVIPAIIIMAAIPVSFDRYILELTGRQEIRETDFVWYGDLTGDGYSERVIIQEQDHYTAVTVYDHRNVVYHQWNLHGEIGNLIFPQSLPMTGDYNGNGKKELFLFTLSNDSIFLHMIDDLNHADPPIANRFITRIGPVGRRLDIRILPAVMDDLTGDGYKELIFAINGGFTVYPRRVYAYSVKHDTLMRSPEAYYNLNAIYQADITGNGVNELFLHGRATANVSPLEHTYHDFSNWLMVLDQDLDFLFEPVEFPGRANHFRPVVIRHDEGPVIAALELTSNNEYPSGVYFFDAGGQPVGKKIFNLRANNIMLMDDGDQVIAITDERKGTFVFDRDFTKKRMFDDLSLGGMHFNMFRDLTGDGNQEAVVVQRVLGRVLVVNHRMSNYVEVEICSNLSRRSREILSYIEQPDAPPLISLQIDTDHYMFSYRANQAYYLGYVYYASVYAGLLGFSLLSRKIQREQMRKKIRTEKKITELQLSLVGNQLNPHFSINAINAVIHTIREKETDMAADYLRCYARLHRNLLLSAESVHRTLREEIEFCEDYIALEKMRFSNAFTAELEVADGVDLDRNVPKMIIQAYVENAIKHGLTHKKGEGRIYILLKQNFNRLTIKVTDNGVGRMEAARKNRLSTQMGLEMMQDYYALFHKQYKDAITQEVSDLYDADGNALGTQVIVTIKYAKEKQ